MRLWCVAMNCGFVLVLLSLSSPLMASGFAYGVNGEDFSLSTYRVEADGRLRHLGHQPIDKSSPMAIRDPSGRFLLTVSNTTDKVSVFRLNPVNGAAVQVPGSPFATGTRSPFSLQFHPTGRFLYLGVRFGGVGAMSFDPETGVVKPLPGSPFPAQRRTRDLVVHPSGYFLYAVNAYSNSVSAYAINQQSGALSELPGSPYTVGDFGRLDYPSLGMADVPPTAGGLPHAIAMDSAGHFVLVANKAGGSVSVLRVDAQKGTLAAVPGSPFFCGFGPYRLAVHPSGRFVYVTLWASGELAALSLDGDSGALRPVAGSPFPLGSMSPVAVNFNRDANRLYVSNYDSNDIILMDIHQDSGAVSRRESLMTRLGPWWLTVVDGQDDGPTATSNLYAALGEQGVGRLSQSPAGLRITEVVSAQGDATAMAVAPNGRYAYAVNSTQGTLSTFAIDPTNGKLSPVPGGVVPAGRGVNDLSIDANGWYLYTSNALDDSISVFFLKPESGLPEQVRGSPRPAGRHPVAVVLDPAARYAFTVNAESNGISVYRFVNTVSPLLFEARKYGSPFATGKEPLALEVEPTGHYAYVANAGSNDISVFRIHSKTGALAAIPGSPFKTGQRPVDLQVHPEGRWLYVANQDSSTLTVHRIEAGLGALANDMATVALPVQPVGIWFDESDNSILVLGKDRRRVLRYSVNSRSGVVSLKSDKQLSQPVYDFAFIKG